MTDLQFSSTSYLAWSSGLEALLSEECSYVENLEGCTREFVSGNGGSDFRRDGLTFSVNGLTLPPGVDEVVCDDFVRSFARHELCAVVMGNRLLILPISGEFLDPSYVRVDPHRSVWEALGIRRETPVFWQSELPRTGGPSGSADIGLVQRDSSALKAEADHVSEGASHVVIDLTNSVSRLVDGSAVALVDLTMEEQVGAFEAAPQGEPAPVVGHEGSHQIHENETVSLARPLRAGQRMLAPSIEVSGVVSLLSDGTQLRANLVISPGETVAIVGARKRAARKLMSLLIGLEQPDAGLVFHHGVPIGLPSLDGDRWNAALPGVLPKQIPTETDLSVLDFVSFPLRLFGSPSDLSNSWGRSALEELAALGLADQPFDSLHGPDRRLVALARALVGPWPSRFLFDPLYGFDDDSASLARRAIQKRRGAVEPASSQATLASTLVILTDDPDLLRLADRVLGVSGGQVYEAVRRE